MKVITTNLLNRFWNNGVKPIKDSVAGKLESSKVVNSLLTTAAGYALDARQGKALDDKISELNSKLDDTGWIQAVQDGSGHLDYRVKNGFCTISVEAGSASGILKTSAGVVKKVYTMPSKYAPPFPILAPCSWLSADATTINIRIEKNGDIAVWAASKSANYYSGHITYPIG